MDPALLKQRELFKKRAIANPTVESKKNKKVTILESKSKSKPANNEASLLNFLSYKATQGSSQYKFVVLSKIVKHLKKCRLESGQSHPLTIDQILDETNQLDISSTTKRWLVTEALVNNPKILVLSDGKYTFKTPFNITDSKGFLKLLKKYDQNGLGGIFLEDIQECLLNVDKCLKTLDDRVIIITRSLDKKKVVFYNDKSVEIEMEEELKNMWRSIPIEGLDEKKIEEYLVKHGIVPMHSDPVKVKSVINKRKKIGKANSNRIKKRYNDYLVDVLEDYGDRDL